MSLPRQYLVKRATAASTLLCSLVLSACGGGGSGGGGDTSGSQVSNSPAPAPAPAAAITWPDPAAIDWGSALSSAQLNATADVAGTFTYSPAVGTKPEVGVQTLSVTFTPQDTTQYSASTVTRQLTVNKAHPAVRWTVPNAVLQGSALTAAQISPAPYALYGVQGSFDAASYVTADGQALGTATTATAGTAIVMATFVPKDTAHYTSSVASTALTIKPASTTAAIDFSDAKQTIKGFGGSAAWYYSKMTDDRLNVLYGTTVSDSLGLSILRLRIAPADWNASTNTADTSQWTAELANGAGAQARGALVFATPWSPPASMKIVDTERTNPVYSGRLDPAQYANYAQYLNAYIRYAATRGVNLYAVSLQNEPDWDPETYESCLWNADEMRIWSGEYGAAAVSGTTAKLMAPESLGYVQSTTDTLMADTKAAANISVLGGHLYGTAPSYADSAVKLGKELWMTEHYLDSVNKSSSATSWQTSIDDAIALAKEIHDGMTVGQYNAYVYWWLVNSNDSTPTGLIDSSNKPTYFGLGMKHFSYFIRPGYVRYDATSLPQSGVRFSAFGTAAGVANGKVVLVLINENTTDVTITSSINPAGRSLTSLTPYRTTATATFEQESPISVSANTFSVMLPAKSITTLVN